VYFTHKFSEKFPSVFQKKKISVASAPFRTNFPQKYYPKNNPNPSSSRRSP